MLGVCDGGEGAVVLWVSTAHDAANAPIPSTPPPALTAARAAGYRMSWAASVSGPVACHSNNNA